MWTQDDVTIIGTCDDDGSGCRKSRVTKTYTTDTDLSGISPGVVEDNVGHRTVCASDRIIKIDRTAPSCFVSGGSSTWTNGSRTVTASCSDGGSGCVTEDFSYRYDTEMYIGNGGAKGVGDGGSVSDKAGNVTRCAADQEIKIDRTPPRYISVGYGPDSEDNNYLVIRLSDALSGLGLRTVWTWDEGISGHTFPDVNYGGANTVNDCFYSDHRLKLEHTICDRAGNCNSNYGLMLWE